MTATPGAPRSVGIELCVDVARAVVLGPTGAEVTAAAEVAVTNLDDDRALLDALIRLRIELGSPTLPTRLAAFPTGSWMRRIDVTGKTGPELNTVRSEIDRRHHAGSTLLVDDGPRRWLHVIHWPDSRIRRIEIVAERAGFVDAAVEPSPIALGRVLGHDVTCAERIAASGEATSCVFDGGHAVAAVPIDGAGTTPPSLSSSDDAYSVPMFDDIVDPDALSTLIRDVTHDVRRDPIALVDGRPLVVDGSEYPQFPPHDLRSPSRQCVALGAAVGAAGITGPSRPVDIITDTATTMPIHRRPWAIERVLSATASQSAAPGVARRSVARLLPRRRRRTPSDPSDER